jgi:hypothetical protein
MSNGSPTPVNPIKMTVSIISGAIIGGLGGAATGASIQNLGVFWGTVIGVLGGALGGIAAGM